MSADNFDLESGELCLDFANTVDWHASQHPQDRLNDYSDLISWGETAGVLSLERVEVLHQLAEQDQDKAKTVFDRAIRLREAIYRIFSSQAKGDSINPDDLVILNEVLGIAMSHMQLTPSNEGFTWEWANVNDGSDLVGWAVARSAGELMTSDRLPHVRECADDRGCGYLFVDTSRNRSRRWCSMETCGNRAKASRSYKRKRKVLEIIN